MNSSARLFASLVSIALITSLNLPAADAPPTPPAKPAAPVHDAPQAITNYQVSALPANIAITPGTQPNTHTEVVGEPRNSTGHPCTLVDKQDVDELKKLLTSNPDAQKAFADLKKKCDDRIAQPINVPVAQKAADGSWMYPGDFPADIPPFQKVSRCNEGNAGDMSDLGMMYQLTGDAKYGDYLKKMILAYADNYNNYGHPQGWTENKYRSATDGRLTGQFLEDGFWLCHVAFSYDMVHDLPGWTNAERAHVRDDLFKSVAKEFWNPVIKERDYLSEKHNRSAVCTSGVLMAGYASEDDEMINNALYGPGGTKDAPTGGLIKVHFGEDCILPDGMWVEGAPAYQVGIACCGLFNDAETLWHHGIDLYRYRDGVLKRLLDSAIQLSYPNSKMLVACLHDSGPFALLDSRSWFNNEEGVPYECGFRRYRELSYVPVVRNATKSFSMTVHAGPPSLFLDLPPEDQIPPRPVENVNFYSVGYGVLRQATPDGGASQLIMEYGPSAGHAHPSKLGIDFYALGDVSMPFPGVIFPYQDPMDPKWYWTTLGNCAMEVDEKPQLYSGNRYKFPRNLPDPQATQLVFGTGSTLGIQRAYSDTVYPGIAQDRSLFLTPQYLADIFAAFSDSPHKYDLAWHIRGAMTTTLKAEPYSFPEPVADGYNAIDDLTHASSDQAWTATVITPNNQTLRFLAAGGTPTDVYLGRGHFLTKALLAASGEVAPKDTPPVNGDTTGKSAGDEQPPVIIQRRADKNDALYGNVADISGDKTGYVKSVAQSGSRDIGYGLLTVTTAKGTDLCFTAFRPGTYSAGDLNTDAMQAFVRMDGTNATGVYLGGGTSLKTKAATIQRSAPGLAYVEKTTSGSYIVGNPSSEAATVTVTLPALSGLKSFAIDDSGKHTGPAQVTSKGGATEIKLGPASRVEFSK